MFITLDKGYYANGLLLGRISASAIRRRIRNTRAVWKARKIPGRILKARGADFARLLGKIAPQWLEEESGLARGAQVAVNDLLLLNCLPHGFYPPYGGCTSFLEIGRDENRLFKIRDERNHAQAFFIRQLPDGLRIQVGHDIGNLGYGHCFTSAPLAGANNTGSNVPAPERDEPLLTDCHIIRYIAERAKSTRDIPRLLDKLISRKAVMGAAYGRGSIFLFADSRQGLIIEGTGAGMTHRFYERGIQVRSNHFIFPEAQKWQSQPANPNTLRRRERMIEILKRCQRPTLPEEIFALARDRKNRPNSLCNDDRHHFWTTLSAQLQVIDRRDVSRSVNYICCGNPGASVFLPIPITEKRSFRPLAGGLFYAAADRLYQKQYLNPKIRKILRDAESDLLKAGQGGQTFAKAYRMLSEAS